MLGRACRMAGVPILPDAMDADPWALCCENGVIDLRTGILRQPRRQDLITKIAQAKSIRMPLARSGWSSFPSSPTARQT